MLIKAEAVTKIIGGTLIFEDLTLTANQKQIIGIVGRNGCGKTTLLKLLADVETADVGRIIKRKGIRTGYLHQIPHFEIEYTGKDVLHLAFSQTLALQVELEELERRMVTLTGDALERKLLVYGEKQEAFIQAGGYEIEAKVNRVVKGLKLESIIETTFTQLSGGEQTKIMLGQLLLSEPDVLLLDEPTNHLDMLAIDWLEDYLRNFEGATLIISHDRYFLNAVSTSIAEIEDGVLKTYNGNYDRYVKEKEAETMQAFQQYDEQQKKIKKMQEAIKQLKIWANEASPPSASLHRRAKNMEKALARIVVKKRPPVAKKMNLSLQNADRAGNDVLGLEAVSFGYGQTLFNCVNVSIGWKDHIAIVGENGAGKTTLLKIMSGELSPDNGQVKSGSNVKIGYLSQKLNHQATGIRLIDAFRENISITEEEARSVLASFLFYGYDVFKQVASLSGGERMRLRLAQLMYEDVNVLVLDEPTNHLDIESREVLEEQLALFKGTIIAVSHDRYFLNALFNRILWLENRTAKLYSGNYDEAKKQHGIAHANVPLEKNAVKTDYRNNTTTRDYEAESDNIEQQISTLKQEITNESNWENYQDLEKELTTLGGKLEILLNEWIMNE